MLSIPLYCHDTRRKLVHFNLGHRNSHPRKCINKSIWLDPEGTRGVPMEGAPPVANQIDLFMHFLGASRDGLVARPVEMDKLSSSVNRCLYLIRLKFGLAMRARGASLTKNRW
jgi:hypothetical protein